MNYATKFLQKIEEFLASSGMTPTRFGIEAVNDPNFVFKLRQKRPRNCGLQTVERVEKFIREKSDKTMKHTPIKKELNRVLSINDCK
jgi:hypothetical protein